MAKEVRKDWIIGICNTESDGIDFCYAKDKTNKEVKDILIRLIKKDREEDLESYDYGTEEPSQIKEHRFGSWLNGYAVYSEYHIEYTATEIISIVSVENPWFLGGDNT